MGNLDRPRRVARRPLDVAVEAYWIARRHRFLADLDRLPDHVEAVLLPPGEPPQIQFNDFSHSEELIENAYAASREALDEQLARRQ